MTKEIRRKLCLFACPIATAAILPLNAEVFYDNSTADVKVRFDPGTYEVGDQIILSSSGFLTNFSFEYWGTATGLNFAGAANVEARVRFYRMDGVPFHGYPTPDSTLFDSGWFGVPGPTDRNTFVFGADDFGPLGLFIPVKELTWSVQFRGAGVGDALGVDIYTPPTVGQDFPDYWRKVQGQWMLETNAAGPVDFASRFEGQLVPEPSTATFIAAGALGAMLVTWRRKRLGPSLGR